MIWRYKLENKLTEEIISRHKSYEAASKAARYCKTCLFENIAIKECN